MRKDAQLLDVLSPIQLRIQTLAKKIDDTTMQIGAEAYAAARTVYTVTQTPFAKAAMRTASDDLAKRYGRKKKVEPVIQRFIKPGAPESPTVISRRTAGSSSPCLV